MGEPLDWEAVVDLKPTQPRRQDDAQACRHPHGGRNVAQGRGCQRQQRAALHEAMAMHRGVPQRIQWDLQRCRIKSEARVCRDGDTRRTEKVTAAQPETSRLPPSASLVILSPLCSGAPSGGGRRWSVGPAPERAKPRRLSEPPRKKRSLM